ncbi:hypothetical protein F4777DRAFT_581851 [Nemania sp. FL0916]|nr:hypothetical protein F4777DRAFT_581851 [Nemania sp. FL0916]
MSKIKPPPPNIGPFALPVPSYRQGVHRPRGGHHQHENEQDNTTERESQSRSPSAEDFDGGESLFSSAGSRLPPDSINPRSHSPDTLFQLKIAGLSPADELPSKLYPGFPKKPLPEEGESGRRRRRRRSGSRSKGRRVRFVRGGTITSSDGEGEEELDSATASERGESGDDVDGDANVAGDVGVDGAGVGNGKAHTARMRHLNTMTAIMHRCLRDGDIPRAKRALGLLLRTRHVDVRMDNLWAIGTEILMRDGEEEVPARSQTQASSYGGSQAQSSVPQFDDEDSTSDSETEEEEGEDGMEREGKKPPQRWGSASNIAQVKQYLETLVQQHPYDPYRPHLTNAVDFWPALIGIEAYNLDAEFQRALHQIYSEHGFPTSSSPLSPRSRCDEMDGVDGEERGGRMDVDMDGSMKFDNEAESDFLYREGQEGRDGDAEDRDREDEARHLALDALRTETRNGALALSRRIGNILETAPAPCVGELLRLRAYIVLFSGDLRLPSRLVARLGRDRGVGVGATIAGASSSGLSLRETERRLKRYARTPDEHLALARRREDHENAVVLFRRAREAKGRLEGWVLRLLDVEEGGYEDEDDDDE